MHDVTAALALTERSRRLVGDAVVLADAWRLAGRWADGLLLLQGIQPVVDDLDIEHQARHALTTARVLIDQATFGGFDTLARRAALLDGALRLAQQTQNSALLGAVWNARGLSLHTLFLDTERSTEPPDELASFQHGLDAYQRAEDQRGIAESLFHIGLVSGVVRQDHAQALPFFEQSYALAQAIHDPVIASYAIRHIAFAQHAAGDIAAAHAGLQESLQLREQAGFLPGVAMAVVMLAYAAAEVQQPTRAQEHLQRAKVIFQQLGAEQKVAWVEQLRVEFQQHT